MDGQIAQYFDAYYKEMEVKSSFFHIGVKYINQRCV